MTLPPQIPLFPLNVVLFPGMLMPLHIFEPRYRRMLNVCLERHEPFGLVQATTTELPQIIGTSAHIQRVERLPDGRSNILVLGRERFRTIGYRYDQPYLMGLVEAMPMPLGDEGLAQRRAFLVRPLLQDYLAVLEDTIGQHLAIEGVSNTPDSLANLVAIALQVSPDVKQKLLEAASVEELLGVERRLLQTETAILRYMQKTRPLADAAGAATPN